MFAALQLEEQQQQEEKGELLREASRSGASLTPLGRVLSSLFNAEWRSVERAPSSDGPRAPPGSIGRALTALLENVEFRLSTNASLDPMHVPLLEHAVKSKDHGSRRKVVGIYRWLFAGTKHGLLLATSLASIVGSSKVDHRVKLGWCVVVRELVEKEPGLYHALPNVQTDEELSELVPPLMCFTKCVHALIQIVCNESSKQGQQKSPTRLTMAAADCITVITKGLVSEPPALFITKTTTEKSEKSEERVLITPTSSSSNENGSDISSNNNQAEASTSGRETENASKEQGARALWDNLDDIILLVIELQEWNEQGRPLHARGLQQVLKRLRFLATYRDSLEIPSGGNIQVGISVLAACWRQYSSLILLEDRVLVSNPDPVIEHWCGALQYWTQAAEELDASETRRADEMRGYALTCLALVLGRLDPRRLEEVLKDIEPELVQTLMNQVRGADIEVVEMAMAILRSLLFRSSAVTSMMEEIVPVLMDMLDTRDSTARAVVLLVAEFLALNPTSPELEKVLARLDSEDSLQRRNGLDVLTELVAVTTKSTDTVDTPLSRTIAVHLFDRLGDEELTNRVEASALFAKLDPSFTLAQLVRLVYSPDARKRSAASSAVEAVLCDHADQSRTITVLLDCLRDLMVETASTDKTAGRKKGAPLDLDRVLSSVSAWASKVQDWEPLIEVLLDKMYTEASNPVIPRFLSHISDQLAEIPNLVFPRIYQRMHDQAQMNEEVLINVSENEDALAELLFQRLSPMLVLRILPLKAFNHPNSKELYGSLLDDSISGESQDQDRGSTITGLLLERMSNVWELDDVRKIAAELTGRLLPDAMLPSVSASLERAARNLNTVTAKACLFTLCTSLTIRGKETLEHPLLAQVRKSLSSIILWSPTSLKGSKEIAKAQHGCIDCFAAMICAEVGTLGIVSPLPSKPVQGDQKMKKLIEEIPEGEWRSPVKGSQESQKRWKILSSVIECVLGNQPFSAVSATLGLSEVGKDCEDAQLAPEFYRLCMANVLISSAQKISASVRPAFAQAVIPPIMNFIQVSSAPRLRAACFQVLFTSIYHLKGLAIAPFAADLLNLSISTIGDRYSTEERTAGTKVLASLLASEDSVLKEIAPHIDDARRAVATVANMDSSPQLRALCEQLLSCMTKTD